MAVFWIAQVLMWGAVFCDAERAKPIDMEVFPILPFPGPRPRPRPRPSCLNMICEPNKVCIMESGFPSCVDPCYNVDCGPNHVCFGEDGGKPRCVIDPCSTVRCGFNQVCVVEEGGKPRCVAPGVCTASGDPHFCTFDNVYYDFMGTCKYTFAKTCGDVGDLPNFTIHIKNDNRGNVAVSHVAEVTLLTGPHTIVAKKYEFGQIRVDNHLRDVSVSLMDGMLMVYQSGNSVLMQLGDHMQVSYDWNQYVRVEVSGRYLGKMCGMCGNFNRKPEDDFQTPEPTLATDAIAFGSSWKVEDNTVCWHDCGESCFSCPADSRERYSTVDYCGLMNKEGGPFSECNKVINPEMYMKNCIYDVCIYDGFKKYFCEAVQAYAETCQRAGVAIEDWRKAAGCPMQCPKDSSYVLCGRDCPATCEDPEGKVDRKRPCVESCQCNPRFVKSGGKCIPQTQCGCSYNGVTYAPNQVFWNDNACKQRCVCNEKTREVECTDSPCKEEEECAVRNGIQNCYPRSYGVCEASGDPHYLTYDGTRYDFQGTCVYLFTGVCELKPGLVDFNVSVQNKKVENTGVSTTDKVYISVYGMQIVLSTEYPNQIMIDGILKNPPLVFANGQCSFHLNSNSAVISCLFGLTVTYDYSSIIKVTVPRAYANALCGLCGNFNENPSDDLTPKGETSPTDPIPFGKSWKVREVLGCGDDWNEVCKEFDSEVKRQMDTETECGVLMSRKGPFRNCRNLVDPDLYFSSCVFDNCILKDQPTAYCSVMTSYVIACQQKGRTVHPWRTKELCPMSCPKNSHYELCADACQVTCNGLTTPRGCNGNCTEGCVCNNGFILSGGQCVPISECGCNHNGAYYTLGESVYDGKSCDQICSCTEGGVMTYVPWYCSRHEECRKQNGVLGCFLIQ